MGFFGKIKENLNHGGIKVDFQAPASVSMNDATVPVTINVTNSGQEQQTINKVSAEITETSHNQNFQMSNNTSPGGEVYNKVVARADNAERFALMPGETKSVQVNILMNAGAAFASQLPQGSGMAQVAGALEKLQQVSEAINPNSYTYSLRAAADVDGVGLDPAKEYPIQVLKPGEFGTAANIHL